MLIEQRALFRRLNAVLKEMPDSLNEKDSRFLRIATQNVIDCILQAEEPVNSTRTFHQHAEEVIEQIEAFVQQRKHEQWSNYSTFLYGFVEKAILNATPESKLKEMVLQQ